MLSLDDLRDFLPSLLLGTVTTLEVTALAIVLALVLGLFVGIVRTTKLRWLTIPATFYVDLIRGTPLILQIFYVYYVLPLAGVRLDAFTAGVISLGLNYGAYLSEVFRSGIEAIALGQREAGWALGLSRLQIMRLVILPQAFRIVIPTVGNYFIALFKDSALVSVIALTELLRAGQLLAATTYRHFEIYTIVALIYFAISYPASRFVTWLELRFKIDGARTTKAPTRPL